MKCTYQIRVVEFVYICRYTQLEVDEHVAVCLSAMDWEEEGTLDF